MPRIITARFAPLLIVAAFFSLGSFSAGQEDPAKQKAIDQLRQIANSIKQCPEQKTTYQDECKTHNSHVGPPANVEWDVVPSKTVRSPFQGFIEFTLPSRSEGIDQPNLSKAARQKCVDRETLMTQAEASSLADEVKNGPKWRDGHYRYEFDLGAAAPELIKMLWVVKDRNNNIITSAVTNDTNSCWVTAAKTGGIAKTVQSSAQPKP
jgi:hypothetical protein